MTAAVVLKPDVSEHEVPVWSLYRPMWSADAVLENIKKEPISSKSLFMILLLFLRGREYTTW